MPGQINAPPIDGINAYILWNQNIGSNVGAYVDQMFPDMTAASTFAADDFSNTGIWSITSIFVPGDGWSGFTTLDNATTLNWEIYTDNNSMPDGDPAGGGNAPYWSLSLSPDNPQVTITTGNSGLASNTRLDLDTPLDLPPGTWWLIFYPDMSHADGGQYGRHIADTSNGAQALIISPEDYWGWGSTWQPTTVLTPEHDLAFSLEGSICIDDDGDGYGDNCSAGPDCDDGDSDVNPDATEICNGIDDNCDGQIDEGDVCAGACTLTVMHKKIRAEKLFKDRKVTLKITGSEDFDMDALIDLGPLMRKKTSFNRKKNKLKIKAIVPAGLEPGMIPISVGDCTGEVEITGAGG